MDNYEELSIQAIASGKVIEQADYQLKRAIENCLDPNTDVKGERKVMITLVLKPTADRETAGITFKVDAKLQTDAAGVDVVHMSRQGQKGYVSTGQQMTIDDAIGAVTDLNKGETK